MDVVALLLHLINMVAKFKSNAMYKGGHDELFGAYANSTLWQNYQSNTICNSELVRSLVVGGPIFNLLSIL